MRILSRLEQRLRQRLQIDAFLPPQIPRRERRVHDTFPILVFVEKDKYALGLRAVGAHAAFAGDDAHVLAAVVEVASSETGHAEGLDAAFLTGGGKGDDETAIAC
jgi:hypothetical protein